MGEVVGWERQIRIGIIGDFEPAYHSHFATNAALYDAATKPKVPLELRWLPTPSLEVPDAKRILGRWDGLHVRAMAQEIESVSRPESEN